MREVAFPMSAREFMAARRGDSYAREELAGVTVLCVDLRLELKPSRLFPNGRVVRARLTINGFTVESRLDVDSYIVGVWIAHLKLVRWDRDLLSLAA